MSSTIKTYALPVKELTLFLTHHFLRENNLELKQSEKIIQEHLIPELDKLKDDTWVVAEFPYVDRMYRDTFYHYYASKLKKYQRDTVKLSFFKHEVTTDDFLDQRKLDALREAYLGFMIIRPTFPKIIGRSALSTNILRNQDFLCCVAPIQATANNLKFSVKAFPHASQDGQTITCAETTIWSLLEYFGNKYPEYKPLLPSHIHQLLNKFSYKRQIPSDGLTAEQIAFVIKEVGFGAMFYSKAKHENHLNVVLSTFIESGIPVIGVLKGEKVAHAVNIIGREKDNHDEILKNATLEEISGGMSIIDLNEVKRLFVFIDDNKPPYQLASLDEPCKHYNKAHWDDCKLNNIIVPLYHRIYLDPIRARKNFLAILSNTITFPVVKDTLLLRIFLASSRSYKEYISLDPNIDSVAKKLILAFSMPKFVWIAELSTSNSFKNHQINGVLIQDATEPSDYTDESGLTDISVFCGLFKTHFFANLEGKFKIFDILESSFSPYKGNLS